MITSQAAAADGDGTVVPLLSGPVGRTPHGSFDEFYRITAARLMPLAGALTGDWAAAEDLVHDVLLDAHRRWPSLQTYDAPEAWARRAVLNRAVSRWRRARSERSITARLGARLGDGAVQPVESDPAFWSAVRRLPRQQAMVVALHYLDDLSVDDIAARLGCSSGTVKTHLSRARQRLATDLMPSEEDR